MPDPSATVHIGCCSQRVRSTEARHESPAVPAHLRRRHLREPRLLRAIWDVDAFLAGAQRAQDHAGNVAGIVSDHAGPDIGAVAEHFLADFVATRGPAGEQPDLATEARGSWNRASAPHHEPEFRLSWRPSSPDSGYPQPHLVVNGPSAQLGRSSDLLPHRRPAPRLEASLP